VVMLESLIKAPVILEGLGIGEVKSDAVLSRELRGSEGLLEDALVVRRKPVGLEIRQAPPREPRPEALGSVAPSVARQPPDHVGRFSTGSRRICASTRSAIHSGQELSDTPPGRSDSLHPRTVHYPGLRMRAKPANRSSMAMATYLPLRSPQAG